LQIPCEIYFFSKMKLKQKSAFNAEASKLLIKNSYYAPSVHCSYYSVFQLMKVAMKEFNGVDYNTIDINVASSKSSEHKYIHTEILKLIKNNDYSEYSKMSRYIKDLYQFRITSDYKNEEVSFEKATKANKYSQELIFYIKENFHV